MPKCYLIGCDLQTMQNRESSSIIRAINQPLPHVARCQIQSTICVFDVSDVDVIPITCAPHDEFSGNHGISLVKGAVMFTIHQQVRLLAAAGVILAGAHAGAAAEDASRWDGDARSAVRLIAGTQRPAADMRAGIEIRLKSGWHTYWRYPGDAGVPPQFDFKGSQNLREVEVLWPAPELLPEVGGITVIGYDRDVILPLRIVPQDSAKPVALRLKLDYAICEKLCVPAEARTELVLRGGTPAPDGALVTAEARVPKKRKVGDGGALSIRSVRREDGSARARVWVDVAAPMGASVDLIAEGPTPDWSLPLPMAVDGAPEGLQRFVFELDGMPPGVKPNGATITLTAITPDGAIEVATRLD
jgi:DsbC/DsbD-like thiol-disulfide interchange protein